MRSTGGQYYSAPVVHHLAAIDIPLHHGRICPSALVPGPPWPAASTGGGSRDYGTSFWLRCSGKLMPSGRLIGKSITWTAPMCGHISTLPGQRGEGDQALGRSRGGFGTKIHLRVEGQGKPVAFVLTPGLRRQRVQQPQDSGLSQTAGNSLHHLPENQRTAHRSFQPGPVPATQSGGADNQPAKAIPPNRHPV